MIVYKKLKKDFLTDVRDYIIEDIIQESLEVNLGRKVGLSEYTSWQNSLQYMANIMNSETIPDDAGIAIEYNIPRTNNRIDFIVSGQDEHGKENVVLIELKQWSEIKTTNKDAIVITRFKSGESEELHPCYQAWSYSTLLYGFNETVYSEDIKLQPCAYMHNYANDNKISSDFYKGYIEKAPLFCKEDKIKLREFISSFIKHGDKNDIILKIENSRIKPSKNLSDSMVSMIKGNQEFVMIDDQKKVYEAALASARQSSKNNKKVLIVHGGPGTGKSVIAVNLLVELTKKGFLGQYITKNAAPRAVYESKLTGTLKKTEISNFFTGSGSFTNTEENIFDALIVDEAHRLNDKSGLFRNLGENQIKEIINSSKFSIFFIDENQKVTLNDIGREDEIKKWADFYDASTSIMQLTSQFRCNGSDGYLSWLDNTLQIKETANIDLSDVDYDFKVFDSPISLRDEIYSKNEINNKSRLVAGYCWDWKSKKDSSQYDIIIPEHDFKAQWNLGSDGSLWIIKPSSVKEVGCIHTCQGLELDYVGVIIGPDMVYRNGDIVTDAYKRSGMDKSIHGHKKLLKEDESGTLKVLDEIIKNTYRTLMSRGAKGCYVYFTDDETREYFKSKSLI